MESPLPWVAVPQNAGSPDIELGYVLAVAVMPAPPRAWNGGWPSFRQFGVATRRSQGA
jgi:hypothetical protein